MKKVKSYIGQLRLYSLADLVLLLIAIQAEVPQFIGAITLHIAFLAYLESKHSHSYRAKVPLEVSYVLAFIGAVIYGRIEGFIYIIFSVLYTQKIHKLGFVSPVCRALQTLFIVAGIIGYYSPITYVAAGLLFLRNVAGDFRDTEKDKKEGMKTLPVLMGANRNVKYIHLILTIVTSTVWWYLSPLYVGWLFLVIVIQISTYNLTSR